MYDVVEEIVGNAEGDFEVVKLQLLTALSLDTKMTQSDFARLKNPDRVQRLYAEAEANYQAKNHAIADKVTPVLMQVQEQQGQFIRNIVVPFSDGLHEMQVVADLKKSVETGGREVITEMEKSVVLSLIDQEWKEHLREMDDLKQSVQQAVYEQKDPLLIYKFEALELFKRFVARVNSDTISFLMKADIPVQDSDEVREARQQRPAPQPRVKTTKEEAHSVLEEGNQHHTAMPEMPMPPAEKIVPMRSQKVANRNDLVSVQYADGSIKRDVKYKKIEEDLKNNRCIIIE
jgi:preprotein translocase subunit SecA